MKKSKIFSILFLLFSFLMLSFTDVNANCETECTYIDSETGALCAVSFVQHFGGSGIWAFGIACTDGYTGRDGGSGIYTGTICGGLDPVMCEV
ncbi:hypothetical protein DYD21_12150 [Rhodohalobacter sp. SW132]|uniref:hypothetical protein n=1 Tax=Rhodohalobacter sp. SW132 TaxID=2293433 RepID=UPI000E254367|nr:hypothetical protein [Rhodohalobacter sp. SW132]REL33514.1 hypothetical protein DYD21_12150 [Rhodohalobacter sp. SW132]